MNQSPYKGPLVFMVNGAVDPSTTFMVSFAQWNTDNLIEPVILKGGYRLLVWPSQSGKTTRIKELVQQLNNKTYKLPGDKEVSFFPI